MALFSSDVVTPSQGEGQKQWYNMVEVNKAYNPGSRDRIWLNNVRVMFNAQAFALQDSVCVCV